MLRIFRSENLAARFSVCQPPEHRHHSRMSPRIGMLLVVSGPSGSGKTTLCRRLADTGDVRYSISCTTRTPRPGELDGRDYHFLSRADFETRLAAGDFLEHAEVHGNLYGTLRSEVVGHLKDGCDIVMDIDVQGATQIRHCTDSLIQLAFVDLFVMPPSAEELLTRLSGRNTDSEQIIATRMANALGEMGHWNEYQYVLHSASREEDYERFVALVTAERMKVARLGE